jgi:hypothetical protein
MTTLNVAEWPTGLLPKSSNAIKAMDGRIKMDGKIAIAKNECGVAVDGGNL